MSMISRSGAEFRKDGKKFRFVGVNYYSAVISMTSRATLRYLFQQAAKNGITVIRTWCFDSGNPPSDTDGNFRFLDYPLGTNLLTNGTFETDTSGWTLESGLSRSNLDSHGGSYAIKHVVTSGYNGMYSDAITVTASTDYTLTFWYKIVSRTGFGPFLHITKPDLTTEIYDGGLLEDTTGGWVRKQINFNSGANTSIVVRVQNFSGNVSAYYDDFTLNVAGTPTLSSHESTFAQLDMVLDEAQQAGVKLILSLADNPTYHTKDTYISWANSIYGSGLSTSSPYVGFFSSTDCQQLYKDFVDLLVNRVNTINGRTYKEDDTIFSWELGNELRVDQNDTSGQNTVNGSNLDILTKANGWADVMSSYIKSVDPNHLVGFSSMAHTWQWVNGDTVSNGTYYGVDYNLMTQLANIDYLDAHCYPTQAGDGTQLMTYGQRLGCPNQVSARGFRLQLQDYVKVGHGNSRPVILGEIGFPREVTCSNTYYPLYPRHNAFKNIFKDFFDAGGDGIILWSATTGSGGSYSIVLDATGGENTTDNSDDTKIMSLIHQRNHQLSGKRIPVDSVRGIGI